MKYLETYLQSIRNRGNIELAESIQETVNGIAPKYLEQFSFCDHEIGLLFGNVQSGKTGQMFGIIAAAADLGFPVFVILTTDNVVLQQQTIERVREDLKGYCICDEYDSEIFTENSLMEPAIIVLKKNVNTLKQWSNILGATGFIKGNPLFIIDDEADAASLNTLINKGRKSSINRYLDEIKNSSACSIYLQVTGTPQALLLQSMASGWHPYFTYYFRPGKGYLGGDFFFPKAEKTESVTFIDDMPDPMKAVVFHHLIVSAQFMIAGNRVCNCLIHPSVRKAVHSKYRDEVLKELGMCREKINEVEFIKELEVVYNSVFPVKTQLESFEMIYQKTKGLLVNNEINVLVMNGDSSILSENYAMGSNIIIGGNTLGRGVTFSGLQTIYYTRSSKKPQADTMWQHSRMFGYDRDPGMMKVFIEKNLYKLFSDINATNNSIISQVERGINDIKIYYPEGMSPTRKNVLDIDKVSAISGGTNYYPINPDNNTIEKISLLLEPFDEQTNCYQVSLRLIKEILAYITSDSDFKISVFSAILDTLLADQPAGQGVLIVRRNRNIAKGSGALLSPNDWQFGGAISDRVVLTMYQMTGEKGWKGRKIWVPNIKLPDKLVYYSVDEDGATDMEE